MKKYISEEAAIENLKRFFSRTEKDTVSISEVYTAWGRDMSDEKEALNRLWLSNKMTGLKYHNLIKPLYILKNSRRTLDKLQLTLKGKNALGRMRDELDQDSNLNKGLTPQDIMKMIVKLRTENPDYVINFDIKLKES